MKIVFPKKKTEYLQLIHLLPGDVFEVVDSNAPKWHNEKVYLLPVQAGEVFISSEHTFVIDMESGVPRELNSCLYVKKLNGHFKVTEEEEKDEN